MNDYVKKSGGAFTGPIYDPSGGEILGGAVLTSISVGENTIQTEGVTNFFAWAGVETDGTGLADAGIFQGNQAAVGDILGVVEIVIQNLATTGTSDIIGLMDTGTDESGFIDMGINGSEYDGNVMGWGYQLPGDGYFYVAPPVTGNGGHLAVGVIDDRQLQLFAGGTEGTNVKMIITDAGVQFGFLDENTDGGPSTFTTPILDMAGTPKTTIDPSARKLFYPDGTTSALDYSSQGEFTVGGTLKAGAYKSSDATSGATSTVTGLVFKDGLYTSGSMTASTDSTSGIVELLTTAEIDIGTDTTRAMTAAGHQASLRNLRFITIRLIDSGTDVSTGTVGGDFTVPFTGVIVQDDSNPDYFAAYTDTAGVTGLMVVDVHLNGTTIMDTNKLDIETGEKDSTTATTQPDLTTTAITKGDILTIDVDAIHTTPASGLSVTIAIRPT